MKNYSQAVKDALLNNNATANLIDLNLAGGAVYITDAGRDVEYMGRRYIASGLVASVGGRKQQSQMQVQSVAINFTTADQSIIALFSGNQKGYPAIVREVVFDDATVDVVGELLQQRYIINNYSQDDDSFSVDLSNYAARWRTVRGMRTTQASHQLYFPQSASFVNSKDLTEVEWGGE